MVVFSSYACVVLFAGFCPELGRAADADDAPVAGVVVGVVVGVVDVVELAVPLAAALVISLAMVSVSPRIAITCSSSLN